MTVDANRKASMISMEYGGGFLKYQAYEKAYLQEPYDYQSNSVVIYKGHGDTGAPQKVDAVKKAVKSVVDFGFTLPKGVRFYCINNSGVQNRAFARDPAWNPIYYITLGPSTCTPTSVASISNSPHPGYDKGHVTCIHELGHLMHAQSLGENFYAKNDGGGVTGAPSGAQAVKVSMYAGGSKKEFVAEVFAGMVIGRTYDKGVMDEYQSYGGPTA